MKKKTTITELRQYCEEKKPKRIIFHAENQRWFSEEDTMGFRTAFPQITVSDKPSLVCLRSGSDMIYFERVKTVEIDTDATVLGTLITLVCGDWGASESDKTYTLIAEY